MNFFSVVFESQPLSDQVQECSMVVRDSESQSPLICAKIYCFEVGAEYPTEHLSSQSVADLWMAQEELDQYLETHYRPGQWVGWIDSIEKMPSDKQINASQVFGQVINDSITKPILFKETGTNELFLYPYPLGVADADAAVTIQAKLIEKYQKDMLAEHVGNSLMRVFV